MAEKTAQDIQVYDGAAWKSLKGQKVYDGSNWKDFQGVYDGTDWCSIKPDKAYLARIIAKSNNLVNDVPAGAPTWSKITSGNLNLTNDLLIFTKINAYVELRTADTSQIKILEVTFEGGNYPTERIEDRRQILLTNEISIVETYPDIDGYYRGYAIDVLGARIDIPPSQYPYLQKIFVNFESHILAMTLLENNGDISVHREFIPAGYGTINLMRIGYSENLSFVSIMEAINIRAVVM